MVMALLQGLGRMSPSNTRKKVDETDESIIVLALLGRIAKPPD